MKRIQSLEDAIYNALTANSNNAPQYQLMKEIESHVKDFMAQKLAAAYFLEFENPEDVVTFLIKAFDVKRIKMASEFVAMAKQEQEE